MYSSYQMENANTFIRNIYILQVGLCYVYFEMHVHKIYEFTNKWYYSLYLMNTWDIFFVKPAIKFKINKFFKPFKEVQVEKFSL